MRPLNFSKVHPKAMYMNLIRLRCVEIGVFNRKAIMVIISCNSNTVAVKVELEKGSLGFTFCTVSITYTLSDEKKVVVIKVMEKNNI